MFGKIKNNRGFTLVELLAVIAILSLIVGFTVYVSLNVMNKTKEKSYATTTLNIESAASDYLVENNVLFEQKTENGKSIEYKCITIQNLIDRDYFDESIMKSKVRSDRTVLKNDYIYVQRDINTKTIVKKIYDIDGNYCS